MIAKSSISKEIEPSKYIFTAGNLVICDDGFIVLVNEEGHRSSKVFSGTIIHIDNDILPNVDKLGDYITDWQKSEFKQFYGKVTLEI